MENKSSVMLALVAVALTVGALWFTNRVVTPKDATMEDVLNEAKAGGYRLITTEELSERYCKDAKAILLVDTRQEWEYRTGHIEGAVNFPMEPTWWSRWQKAEPLESVLGLDKDRTVVFY